MTLFVSFAGSSGQSTNKRGGGVHKRGADRRKLQLQSPVSNMLPPPKPDNVPPPSPTTLKAIDFYHRECGYWREEVKKCVNNIRQSWGKQEISDLQLDAGIKQNKRTPPRGYDHKWRFRWPFPAKVQK